MMEDETIPGNRFTLFQLIYDLWMKMIQWLGFNKAVNLVKVDDVIKDNCFTHSHKLAYDFKDPIDEGFYYILPFVRSLTLTFGKIRDKFTLRRIQNACGVLDNLTIKRFDRCAYNKMPFGGKLETLSLNGCFLGHDDDFFDTFNELEGLNIRLCEDISYVAMTKCFKNNPGIKSFTCDSQDLPYSQLLLLLPSLERLRLNIWNTQMKFNNLSKLDRLRNLTLHCCNRNANNILTELAKTNILEKLELIDVGIDEDTFERINSLDKLQLLVVTKFDEAFSPSVALPPNIKHLKLGGFRISLPEISLSIKQLKYIEGIHFQNCTLDHNGILVGDFQSIAELLLQTLELDTEGQLDVILTSCRNNFSSKIITGRHLRISNSLENPSDFCIFYPGTEDN